MHAGGPKLFSSVCYEESGYTPFCNLFDYLAKATAHCIIRVVGLLNHCLQQNTVSSAFDVRRQSRVPVVLSSYDYIICICSGQTLPYTPGILAVEIVIVLLLAGVEILRLFFGMCQRLEQIKSCSCGNVRLCHPPQIFHPMRKL